MARYDPKAARKIGQVMHEFKEGELPHPEPEPEPEWESVAGEEDPGAALDSVDDGGAFAPLSPGAPARAGAPAPVLPAPHPPSPEHPEPPTPPAARARNHDGGHTPR